MSSDLDTASGIGRKDGLQYGLFLLIVSVIFAWGASQISSTGSPNNRDPGPQLFPWVLSAVVGLSGAGFVARSLIFPSQGEKRQAFTVEPLRQPLAALTGMVLCTAAMPWAGFVISAFVFLTLMLKTWGARWLGALTASVLMVVVIQVVFVRVFRVLLPLGPFNF